MDSTTIAKTHSKNRKVGIFAATVGATLLGSATTTIGIVDLKSDKHQKAVSELSDKLRTEKPVYYPINVSNNREEMAKTILVANVADGMTMASLMSDAIPVKDMALIGLGVLTLGAAGVGARLHFKKSLRKPDLIDQ